VSTLCGICWLKLQHGIHKIVWHGLSFLSCFPHKLQHYRANEAYIVIYMYARVCMQSLTLIEQVVLKIFEVVERWVAAYVWVGVSSSTVLNQSIHHTLWPVTDAMKFWFRRIAWGGVTTWNFRQAAGDSELACFSIKKNYRTKSCYKWRETQKNRH